MKNDTRSIVAVTTLSLAALFNTAAAYDTTALPYPLYGQTMEEQETLEWLWPKAQRFSGIKSVHDSYDHLPIYKVTEAQMTHEVCPTDPQNCRNLGAVYETEDKYILIRDDLTPESDIMSASFLLHEFTHALQNEIRTDEQMYGTCERLKRTELEAYDAQNAFLKDEGAFFRAGVGMRMMVCKDKNGSTTEPMATASPP